MVNYRKYLEACLAYGKLSVMLLTVSGNWIGDSIILREIFEVYKASE